MPVEEINVNENIFDPWDILEDDSLNFPPNEASYPSKCGFSIDLPLGGGAGVFCTTSHYFDPQAQYGYPPSMVLEMVTSCTCDFMADIWAKDINYDLYYNASGASYQNSVFLVKRTFFDVHLTLRTLNSGGYRSVARVWDDEDYGTFYNLTVPGAIN